MYLLKNKYTNKVLIDDMFSNWKDIWHAKYDNEDISAALYWLLNCHPNYDGNRPEPIIVKPSTLDYVPDSLDIIKELEEDNLNIEKLKMGYVLHTAYLNLVNILYEEIISREVSYILSIKLNKELHFTFYSYDEKYIIRYCKEESNVLVVLRNSNKNYTPNKLKSKYLTHPINIKYITTNIK